MREPSKIKFKPIDLAAYSLLLLLFVLQLFVAETIETLRYDRAGLAAMEIWRLFTGHMIHLSWSHLAFNAIALLFLKLLFANFWRANVAGLTILALAPGISLLFFWLNPELDWYVGFSGVLSGLFVISACLGLKSQPWMSAIVLLGLVIKVATEQWGGQTVLSGTAGIPTVVDAHLYGLVLGLLLAWPVHYFHQVRDNKSR